MNNNTSTEEVQHINWDMIKKKLDNGIIPDENFEYTLMILAAKNEKLKILNRLIKLGEDPNITIGDEYGTKFNPKSMLAIGAAIGNMPIIKKALHYKPPIEILNEAFRIAAFNGETKTMKILVEHGAKIDSQDKYGDTALHYSVINESVSCIRVLHGLGANFDILNYEGHSAFHLSLMHKKFKISLALLGYGSDINTIDKKGNSSVSDIRKYFDINLTRIIMKKAQENFLLSSNREMYKISIQNNEWDSVIKHIKHGAGINHIDLSEVPLTILASRAGRTDLLYLLLKKGLSVNVSIKSNNGECEIETIFSNIINNNDINTFKRLLTFDVSDEILNETLIHWAHFGYKDFFSLLSKKNINIDYCDENGMTSMHHAAEHGSIDAVSILHKNGANHTILDKNKKTPLDLSIDKKRTKTTKFLRDLSKLNNNVKKKSKK